MNTAILLGEPKVGAEGNYIILFVNRLQNERIIIHTFSPRYKKLSIVMRHNRRNNERQYLPYLYILISYFRGFQLYSRQENMKTYCNNAS